MIIEKEKRIHKQDGVTNRSEEEVKQPEREKWDQLSKEGRTVREVLRRNEHTHLVWRIWMKWVMNSYDQMVKYVIKTSIFEETMRDDHNVLVALGKTYIYISSKIKDVKSSGWAIDRVIVAVVYIVSTYLSMHYVWCVYASSTVVCTNLPVTT